METIQTLLKFVAKMSFGLLFAALVWWLIGIAFPELRFSSLAKHTTTGGFFNGNWLPSPRNVTNLLGTGLVPTVTSNVYVPGASYNGVANSPRGSADVNFITYDQDGRQVIQSYSSTTNNQATQVYGGTIPTAQRSLYVRNLSLYEGGTLYTGISFVGEAKSSMFYNGRFPIVVVDQWGHVLAVTAAEATTNWAVPGWVRFQAKIQAVLPNRVPCTLVFQSGDQSVKVVMPEICN